MKTIKEFRNAAKALTNIDVINSRLPDEKFIAVFGTSHSSGACDRGGDDLFINNEDVWATQLAEKMGVKVVNFSVPGTTNTFLMLRLMEFLQMEKSKNCTHVFFENRFAEMALELSFDKSPFHPSTLMTYYETGLVALGNEVGISKFTIDNLVPDYYSNDREKQKFHNIIKSIENVFFWRIPLVSSDERLRETLNKHRSTFETEISALIPEDQRDTAWDEFVENIVKYKTVFRTLHHGGLTLKTRDLVSLASAGMMVKARGINFNWFCWDTKPVSPMKRFKNTLNHNPDFYERHGISTADELNDGINNLLENVYPFLFEDEIKSLTKGATATYLYEFGDLPECCNCGHQTESFHSWVAEKIYKYLIS